MPEANFIFRPTNKDLRVEYPELSEVSEFASLSKQEMVFVWWYACRSSKYINIEDEVLRTKKALERTYGKGKIPKEVYDKYMSQNFPEKVVDAINRIKQYSPEVRTKAKMLADDAFSKWEKLLDVAPEDLVELEDKKKFADLYVLIMKNQPFIVAELEKGYGVSTTTYSDGKEHSEGMNIADYVLTDVQLED